MLTTIAKFLLSVLAEETVKVLIKDTIKKKVTSKTETDFDDGLVDVMFEAKDMGELARNSIQYGANKLIEATDDGIKNGDISNFLNSSVKSKRNGMNRIYSESISRNLKKNEKRAYKL